MARAVKCPICHGSGKEPKEGLYPKLDDLGHEKKCHGCGGKGWVEVSS